MEQQIPTNPVQAPQSPVMAPLPVPGVEQTQAIPELPPLPQEVLAPASAAPTSVQAISQTPPSVPQVVPQAVADDDQPDETPQDADDIDVIEKAWVDRAKSIVAKTKADPHEQEKQVSILQADYMKKRYGRDLGLVEK